MTFLLIKCVTSRRNEEMLRLDVTVRDGSITGSETVICRNQTTHWQHVSYSSEAITRNEPRVEYRWYRWCVRYLARVVLVFLNFWHFSPERTQTWSLGATECEVWIGNFNVKAWITTKHKLHKIWCTLKFCKKSVERAFPRLLYDYRGLIHWMHSCIHYLNLQTSAELVMTKHQTLSIKLVDIEIF